jgi:hypothetical protein
MALKTHRPVDIWFRYLFDREDLERIGRAQNKKPRDLTDDDINQYVLKWFQLFQRRGT